METTMNKPLELLFFVMIMPGIVLFVDKLSSQFKLFISSVMQMYNSNINSTLLNFSFNTARDRATETKAI